MSNLRNNLSWQRFLPISLPLAGRIVRDYWLITFICATTLFSFHWLVVTFLPLYNMRYRLNYIRHLPNIVRAMIGQDVMDMISSTSIGAFAYLHPISLTILMAFAILLPTWVLVGQIDRGTIELILSTPTSRKKILTTTILAGILGGAVLIVGMLLGTRIGIHYTRLPEPVDFNRLITVAVNLYCLYIQLLAIGVLFSVITSQRGIAVGWTMALAIVSYLLHFLSEWWAFIEKIAFLGPLYYFRPIKIATGLYDPTRDMTILLGTSGVIFIISYVWFSRRDIAVV